MLANFITGSRIIFSLAMLTFPIFSAGFYFFYITLVAFGLVEVGFMDIQGYIKEMARVYESSDDYEVLLI